MNCFGIRHTRSTTHLLCQDQAAMIDADFGQLSFLMGNVSVRSTFRRYAMAAPASVHCVSRQLVFGNLSCTGFGRETWHPRNHERFTIHRIISHWILVCSSCSSFVCPPLSHLDSWDSLDHLVLRVRTRPGAPPRLPTTETGTSHQYRFLSVSCRCFTRCFLRAQLCNRDIANC